MHRRPELYHLYLDELLNLFIDKGVAIQNLAISNHHVKVSEMSIRVYRLVHVVKTEDVADQLASLLLPIDALLSHADFDLDLDVPEGTVTLFRNMWFLCILFHFTVPHGKEQTVMEWQQPALSRIAVRTPPIVLEAQGNIVNDLEYSKIIRQEYAETVGGLRFYNGALNSGLFAGHRNPSQLPHEAYSFTCQ